MSEGASRPGNRTVVGNILLSLDGRMSGPGGEYDMSWIVPHALTNGARELEQLPHRHRRPGRHRPPAAPPGRKAEQSA